ncbi:BA14K family protein [Bradyrhizobium sp. CB3481]|uniref:BA14K family protein n=1 Tax=Bradyrhizobium sp. CB3481 TaxID=3039158 RepID=UPI0024B20CC9|nr:BA14K family protein [Bradyrhizobium sp. CB3481]WFU18649.1 BA14K family protein [Bradyrhizobium sp. CB3481]
MTNVRRQLDKIRSDAAECVLLSKLVTDGKGQVFVRTAEHLHELALELEKSIPTNSADAGTDRVGLSFPHAGDHEEAASSKTAGQQPAPPRWMLIWMLLVVIILSGVLGASSKQAREYWSLYVSPSKHDTPPSTQDQTIQTMAALLSSESAERGKMIGHLHELNARMDVLISSFNNLNSARDEIAAKSNRDKMAAEEEPRGSTAQAPAPTVTSSTKENSAPVLEGSPAAKQADSMSPETVDQVGAIPAGQRRVAPSPRKSAAGPAGCAQFRSFDPVSETYTTLDGRRRECRQ